MKRLETIVSFNKVEQVRVNLWKYDGKYFRLFGKGITPNGCWIINPEMREVIDINTATGTDEYGITVLRPDSTVSSCHEFVKY